jgi:hypothetical protein
MKITYRTIRLSEANRAIIAAANVFIEAYQKQGYDLTLRQLYYRFVAADAFPESWTDATTGSKNSERSYKRLGEVISDGRMAGLIDWEALVDRTRSMEKLSHWDKPADILQSAADSYRLDSRSTQCNYVEVWVEKDALAGVVERVANQLDVPWQSCRGYCSMSAMWRSSIRLRRQEMANRRTRVIYLGDHDPSGLDMSRDIQERLNEFGSICSVERVALSMAQIRALHPPPSPAKITDSRAAAYIKRYGTDSWELDALPPEAVASVIQRAVDKYTDAAARDAILETIAQQRGQLLDMARKYDDIVRWMGMSA